MLFFVFLAVHGLHEKFLYEEKIRFHQFAEKNMYAPYPYVMFKGREGVGFKKNGYRGPVPPAEKDDSFRVFVLGGSAVWNGSPPFTWHLEELFHQAGRREVKVYNYGIPSSLIGQDLSRIVHEVIGFHPDVVVMYNGYNEMTHHSFGDPRPGYPFNFMLYEANPWFAAEIADFPVGPLLLYRSSIMRSFFSDYFFDRVARIDQLRQDVGYGSEEWKDEVVDVYWANLQKAQRISRAFGANFAAVFQAVIYGKNQIHINHRYYEKNKKDWQDMFGRLMRRRPQGTSYFYDRSSMFDDLEEKVFVDYVHIEEKFRPRIAQEIHDILKTQN